jgi:hypothetical protein
VTARARAAATVRADFVEAVRPYAAAGFTEIALVQVGGEHQRPFIDWAQKELLPALREL